MIHVHIVFSILGSLAKYMVCVFNIWMAKCDKRNEVNDVHTECIKPTTCVIPVVAFKTKHCEAVHQWTRNAH